MTYHTGIVEKGVSFCQAPHVILLDLPLIHTYQFEHKDEISEFSSQPFAEIC